MMTTPPALTEALMAAKLRIDVGIRHMLDGLTREDHIGSGGSVYDSRHMPRAQKSGVARETLLDSCYRILRVIGSGNLIASIEKGRSKSAGTAAVIDAQSTPRQVMRHASHNPAPKDSAK